MDGQFTTGASQAAGPCALAPVVGRLNFKQVSVEHSLDLKPIFFVLEGSVRARAAASVVLAVALLLSTTACTFFAQDATLKAYDPSDGVGATVGVIDVRNALLLSKNGQEASLLINLVNTGEKTENVLIQYVGTNSDGEKSKVNTRVTVAAGAVKTFGSKTTPQLLFNGIDTKPGALFPVWVQYGDVTGQELLVPVLNGSLTEYTNLLPSPTPTPKVSGIPMPTPLASATTAP